MDGWAAASAAIFDVGADPEPLLFTLGGALLPPIRAIRYDREAPAFDHGGASRSVAYEIPRTALPAEPTKQDSFTHRGRRWRIQRIDHLPPVDAWELTVGDDGAAA